MDNTNFDRKGNWFIDQLNVYQSANSDFSSLKNNFLVRMDEFNTIIDAIKSKEKNDPLQHELILGRRGSGKSTLLKRIEIEVLENKKLSKKFVPINLAEEQAGIYRLFDLWEQVLGELIFKFKLNPALKSFEEFDSPESYTKYVYEQIHQICKDMHLRIILLLDNFDRILDNLDDNGNLLRETLINYNDVQIIAGSTRMDEHFWKYDKPFYEFFRRHKLEALSKEEILMLLNHWSDSLKIPELKTFVDNNPGKLENIRLLTDGLPRTLQFFIQMVLQKNDSSSYDYLKKIMDTVTPLYQERLNHLPPPQRKLVLEMAFIWEACSTKQLVEKARMESKLVSAQLKNLVEKGIVDKLETGSKNHLYRISERFFNLWIIVTQGNPEQKQRAKWLSIFLENFYDETTLNQICAKHIELLKNNMLDWESALPLSKALAQSRFVRTIDRDALILLTEKLANKATETNFIVLPKRFQEISKEIKSDVKNGLFDSALGKTEEIENESDGAKDFLRGYIFVVMEDWAKAEQYLLAAENKGQPVPDVALGLVNFEQNKFEAAEKYFLKENAKKERGIHISLLGETYYYLKKFDLAKKYFLMAMKNGDESHIGTLAIIYEEWGKTELAEKYYLRALNKNQKEHLLRLALMYEKKGKFDLAEKYYLDAVKENQQFSRIATGLFYHQQKNLDLAEKYYLMAVEAGEESSCEALTLLYYENNVNKEKALELITKEKLDGLEKILIEIWNGIFENVELRIATEFKKKEFTGLEEYLNDLLIHQQKNLVLNFFNNTEFGKELQDKYVVVYYATLLLTQQGDKNLKLKIPPELNEPIQDLLKQIHEKEIFYGYKTK